MKEYEIGLIFVDDEDYSNKAKWCNEHNCYIDEIKVSVQNVLDAKAQEKNYDNGFAIASYANSTDTIFHDEANRFIVWRDQCWRECYNILAQFQSGEIEMPTVEYVLERLPSLNWE